MGRGQGRVGTHRPQAGRGSLLPQSPHRPSFRKPPPQPPPPTLAHTELLGLQEERKEAEAGIQSCSAQMGRNCLEGKENNINSIVSASRSCLKNKDRSKLSCGSFVGAALQWGTEQPGPLLEVGEVRSPALSTQPCGISRSLCARRCHWGGSQGLREALCLLAPQSWDWNPSLGLSQREGEAGRMGWGNLPY